MAGLGIHSTIGQAEQGRAGQEGSEMQVGHWRAGQAEQAGQLGRDGQETGMEWHGNSSRPGSQGRAVQARLAGKDKHEGHVERACQADMSEEATQAAE